MNLSIAKDFSPYPDGRYRKDGDWCGEAFRDDKLLPAFKAAMKQGDTLEISLDGVQILSPSFLDEAFGGLVRKLIEQGVGVDLIEKTIKITATSSELDYFIAKAMGYMRTAAHKDK